ncbi:hypothetical protein O6H91_15G009000 [Diphasiastrum complanatum]|uniref:Uncharacterized protein n=1 Tax=Diphasiastrum complanatum TaxID=34168 RepID=A0ACC2BFP0_DIPCM|nr:hypothetical protein O6H91_15G009000 [Diphasiastrum complanatum]
MNKFNQPQHHVLKYRRSRKAVRKRLQSPHSSLKLSHKPPVAPISGKRQRKLQKQWRRKEALETGLVTMQEIEMLAVDNLASSGQDTEVVKKKTSHQGKHRFHMKKQKRFSLKQTTTKGKDKKMVEPTTEDPMIE